MVFGFPRKGEVYGTFDVLDSMFDPASQTWSVTLAEEVQKKYAVEALRTFIGKQAIFSVDNTDYSVEFPPKTVRVETIRDNPPGAVQTRVSGTYTIDGAFQNPISVEDFNADMDRMTVSNPKKHFRMYPAGELHSKKFRDQLFKFVTRRGESYGWVANGEIYHRKGSLIMPYVKINKHIEKSVVSYHTHPSKDEPSLTSPDDIQWYMDAAYKWGIRHFYTIMKDRLDHFEFIIKGDNGRKRYLKMDEGKFVDDLGDMLNKVEKEFKDKEELDDYQFCERVTRAWVKDINTKFSHLVEIKYHHHIRPGAPKKQKVLANPGSGNPFPHTSKIKVDDKYLSMALNELKGIDYDWIHYGGDEFSHTMYVYWWLKYHFLPKADNTDRLWLWEKKGLDADTRDKVRKYLEQEVEDGWTNADCLLMIGLFHDIAKKREKEQKIHHSILGADMFKEEIGPELKLPKNLTDRLYLMLQSDVGRKRISEEEFQTIAGDLYPVAKMFHMADRTAHHPYMYTIAARMARREGTLKTGEYGDAFIEMANKHDIQELVKFFQGEALQNPPPKIPTSTTYSASYDIAIDPDTAEFLFQEYDPRKVPGNDGKTAGTFMMTYRQGLYLKMVLSDGYVASATLGFRYPGNLNITGVPVRDDYGLSGAREVYERVGQVLEQAYEVNVEYQEAKPVQAETFDVVPASDEDYAVQPLTNPRPFGSTIVLAGANGSGRREVARVLHHHDGYMLCPMHTTEPRKPGRVPNEDSVNHSHKSFDHEVSNGNMKYWTIGANGHKYGYTKEQLSHPKTVMYTTPRMAMKMKEAMPKITAVFLDNKDSVKQHANRLANRNGVTHEMAKATAKRKHTLRNARHNFDKVVPVQKEDYGKVAMTLINPKKTPEGRKIPKRYLKGLNKEEMAIAAKEIDKGYKYDIDDPDAYEEWKSDIKAKARGYKTVPSKYKKKFIEMYGPLPEKGDFLTKISKATGVKESILKEVEKKGLAAWRTGHRVGANQHAWARGRVYSFVTLGNTVIMGGKKMGDYKLAVKAGLIKENPPVYGPLPNPSPSKQPKASFDWLEKFTAWVELVNMKNKELIEFLDSDPWGKKAGIGIAKAKEEGISRGRFSASRILIMRKKLGLTGPKDYIKAGPIIIRNYYELAQKKWSEADWKWCRKQVSFNSRARGQRGPYTDEKGRPTRKLTALWVWGHDPWRYARKIEKRKTMPKCPDVPWIGRTEKRMYGTTKYKYPEVKINPTGPSDIHGTGTFADKDYMEGEVVFETQAEFQYVNHSDNPNIFSEYLEDGQVQGVANTDITEGEELFLDYNELRELIGLPESDGPAEEMFNPPKVLYHGTSSRVAEIYLKEGKNEHKEQGRKGEHYGTLHPEQAYNYALGQTAMDMNYTGNWYGDTPKKIYHPVVLQFDVEGLNVIEDSQERNQTYNWNAGREVVIMENISPDRISVYKRYPPLERHDWKDYEKAKIPQDELAKLNPPFRRPRLYHGSSVNNLKILKPHPNSTIGRDVVFATPNYEFALAMSLPSSNEDLDIGYVNGKFMIEEQYEGAFDLLKQAAYIYEVDARGFYEHPQFPEMERIIEVSVPVKKAKRIPNVYQELRRIGANLIPYW